MQKTFLFCLLLAAFTACQSTENTATTERPETEQTIPYTVIDSTNESEYQVKTPYSHLSKEGLTQFAKETYDDEFIQKFIDNNQNLTKGLTVFVDKEDTTDIYVYATRPNGSSDFRLRLQDIKKWLK